MYVFLDSPLGARKSDSSELPCDFARRFPRSYSSPSPGFFFSGVYRGLYRGLYKDNGKENGNYYLGFRVGGGFRVRV